MSFSSLNLQDFSDSLSSNSPAPGGGSVSAIAGNTAASLIQMVAGLTKGKNYAAVTAEMKEITDKTEELRHAFFQAADEDSESFQQVMDAFALPKDSEREKQIRGETIQEKMKQAALVPFQTAEMGVSLFPLIQEVIQKGNKNAITDALVASLCATTAVLGAACNVQINLQSIEDEAFASEYSKKIKRMVQEVLRVEKEILLETSVSKTLVQE